MADDKLNVYTIVTLANALKKYAPDLARGLCERMENEALRARVKLLEEALTPFSEAADSLDDDHRDENDLWEAPASMFMTAGDLRRARTLLDATLQPVSEETERQLQSWVRPGSGMARVLDTVREIPGSTGAKIADALNGKVHERTVWTALYRLQSDKKLIRKQDGKWFPI